MTSPWGVPDWRDADAYPRKMTDRTWRWEFLRRRPDYRKAWNECAEKYGGVSRNGVCYALTDSPSKTRRRFGVSVIFTPWRTMSDHDLLFSVFCPAAGIASIGDADFQSVGMGPVPPGFADYRVDLSRPIAPQLEYAAKFFGGVQEAVGGKQRERQRPRQRAVVPRLADLPELGKRRSGSSPPGFLLLRAHTGHLVSNAERRRVSVPPLLSADLIRPARRSVPR
jgi:hypothetical protein